VNHCDVSFTSFFCKLYCILVSFACKLQYYRITRQSCVSITRNLRRLTISFLGSRRENANREITVVRLYWQQLNQRSPRASVFNSACCMCAVASTTLTKHFLIERLPPYDNAKRRYFIGRRLRMRFPDVIWDPWSYSVMATHAIVVVAVLGWPVRISSWARSASPSPVTRSTVRDVCHCRQGRRRYTVLKAGG